MLCLNVFLWYWAAKLHRAHGTCFASLSEGTRYCHCKGLETLTSLASLSWPPCCALCWKCWMRWILPQAPAFLADWPLSPWSKKRQKIFFLVNANYVSKRDVLILKGGRAALSALQFLNLRNSSLWSLLLCGAKESTEENLQKELRDTGECQSCWREAPVEDLIFLLFLIFLFCHILKQKNASTKSNVFKTS